VAAALFAAGVQACRDTAVSGAARGPFCMMGVCYDCLVRIDGRPNQQACMTPVRDGMTVQRQLGAREVAA
jgi:succinate dehydrogenase/fumarate reductase-like Fe-S protein